MISRDLTLTITDTNVSLDKTIILYRYDRGITLNITLKSETYDLVEEITKARAIILRPNKKVSATPIEEIKVQEDADGNIIRYYYELYLDDTYTDQLGEVGKYQIQLQLYSEDDFNECITIAPFSFEVKNPIGVPQDTAAYVGRATASNYSAVDNKSDVPVGDLENGEYLKTEWIDGDLITSGKLNKVETAIDYLVTDSITYATSNDIPSNVSQLNNDAGYLTEHQSLENYATKNYVGNERNEAMNYALSLSNKKADKDHSHEEYLTEHQSLEGLATESYVDNVIGDIDAILDAINGEEI